MGCRLPKLRRAEERSPGKIYSTLRRPQVETKVGVAYTYHFLDFLLGKEEVPVSSVLCLSSVRELPVQVRELYAQGFILVALHPFVHPCGPRHSRIQRQLHRAVLIRETHSLSPSQERSQLTWSERRLETEVCVAGLQDPDPEVIQNYVKKVQDVSEQGVLFVGFLQQPGGGPCFQGHWDSGELSSLHSSPSPIHRHPTSTGTSPTEHKQPQQNLSEPRSLDHNHVEQKSPDHDTLDSNPGSFAWVPLEHNPEELTGRESKHGSVKALKNLSNYCLKELDESTDISQEHSHAELEPQVQNHRPAHSTDNSKTREPSENLQGDHTTEIPYLEKTNYDRKTECMAGTGPDYHPVVAESTDRLVGPDQDPDMQSQGSDSQSPRPDLQNRKAGRTSQGLKEDDRAGSPEPDQDQKTEPRSETPPHQEGSEGSTRHGDGDCNAGLILVASHLEELQRSSRVMTRNNNHIRVRSSEREKKTSPPAQTRMQLFALYNHVGELCSSLRFYSLRVPLRVQREAGLVTAVDAHWLDHMTQHFISGARLIDGFFNLGDGNENGVSSVDSVFIFQTSSEETSPISYDAIVVEQWTIVDGVVVRTDYIPLLQSLAPFGWRLMCVLPTPIIRTNSDGSLSTKQILFLQRPTLQRKRKDFKKLNLRGRNKAKKSRARETHEKKEERENASPEMERGIDRVGENRKEEEEEWKTQKNRKNRKEEKGECPQRDGDGKEKEVYSKKDMSLKIESGVTDTYKEEKIEVVRIPLAKQKSVRWTDGHKREAFGDKEGMRAEVTMSQQLSERALFSGVC
ncbi:raftlin [Hypomesus transpacificus]|uniref:raftlin n=1 Tax=Hypomesus transpacificus TaxID=137520 RepID=UPI001F07EF1F|nr:raftlin [Hypomesus transpacificus]